MPLTLGAAASSHQSRIVGVYFPPAPRRGKRGGVPALPGTTAYAVIQHLRSLPIGAKLTTVELCEVIGGNASDHFLRKMDGALKAGLLIKSRAHGEREWLWHVPSSEDEDTDPPRQIIVKASEAPRIRTKAVCSVFELAERIREGCSA